LASKATGFPIAKIAAKLAVGYTLDELDNDITKVTPASFEPTIDYVVTKIPRFAFEKFAGSKPLLSTAMKSVGEAMAIGRTIHESLQKALASMETGLTGFDEIAIAGLPDTPAVPGLIRNLSADERGAITSALSPQTPDRIRVIAQAMRAGLDDDAIHAVTMYDPWFLARIREIVAAEEGVRANGLPADAAGLRQLKMMGFSDARLAKLTGMTEARVRAARRAQGVTAVFKRIDTCAAEFEAQTPYMYSTYEAPMMGDVECEARPTDRKKVVILGGGPNRIGQGIEFDYCCCHACYALSDVGYETIMINCNPETVSTDYDTSDRLYFEPLTFEHVMEILAVEQQNGTLHGVIVQFGGQTPLKLANALEAEGIPILGTTPDAIDLAEDRERFQALVNKLGLKQPHNGIASTDAEALRIAADIGFPLVIRPSYVLGGRAMEIVRDMAHLERYISDAVVVSGDSPVLLDSYLSGAIECDVDALCDGKDVHVTGIMQHIEEAGVHSGDSACSIPPYSLPRDIIEEIERQTVQLALALNVVGLMNVQFAVKDGDIYLIEVNPRASRTVPFVAKATDSAIASIAARLMAGEKLGDFAHRGAYPTDAKPGTLPMADQLTLADYRMPWFSVKEAVLPFARFPGVDTILGPEMRSTGEVMGWDVTFAGAFLKAQMGAGVTLPESGAVFFSIKDADKTPQLIETAQLLIELGFSIVATRGTGTFLNTHGIACEMVNKVFEGRPNVVDMLKDGRIAMVMNTTEGALAVEDSREIRSVALYDRIPYFTTAAAAHAVALAMQARSTSPLQVMPLQGSQA
jgi:carbamoyl-phosphate synthase large subunit